MRARTRLLVVLTVVSVGLTSCAAGDPSDAPETTLTVLSAAPNVALDPAKSQNLATTTLGLLDRRLTTWDVTDGGEAVVVPDLATTVGAASDGGRTWTFTLKSDLMFSDGSPVTSESIKYGIERSFSEELQGGLSYHKGLLVGGTSYAGPFEGAELPSIETPDSSTIVFHLNEPFGDWPWIASMPAFSPVKESNGNPAAYAEAPITTGPYKVGSIDDGASLTLVRNDYWSPATDSVRTAAADRITILLNQNPATTVQSLIGDDGDMRAAFGAQPLAASELATVQLDPAASERLATSDAGPLQYLAINTRRGALSELKVRQALQYAVDKAAFLVATGGPASAAYATTLITPGIAGRAEFDLYPAPPSGDVAKANQLLSEAGASGLQLTLLTASDPGPLAQAQAIQQGLERARISVELKAVDAATFYADATSSDPTFDLALMNWQPDFPSASSNITPLFSSGQIGNGNYNVSQYRNPEVDAEIAAAQGEVDPAIASADWAALDKQIMADAPVVPLVYAKQSFLRGSDVGNFFIPSFPPYPNYLTLTLPQ